MSIKKKSMKLPKNIVILTMLTTIIVMYFSLSRYETAMAGTANATVALMASSVKKDLIDITGKPRRYI